MDIWRKKLVIIGLSAFVLAGSFSGFYHQIALAMDGHEMNVEMDDHEMNVEADCVTDSSCSAVPNTCIDHCLENIANKQNQCALFISGGMEVELPAADFELFPIIDNQPTLEPFFDPPNFGPDILLTTQKRE